MLKKKFVNIFYLFLLCFFLTSCGGNGFFKGGDARNNPPEPEKRVQKNLEEGRGFRLNDAVKNRGRGTNFEFASSNELWRASLDAIDFMPLSSANYSGGVIITDWYASDGNQNESVKITIRFLSNEIRSDSLDISVFIKKCKDLMNCKIVESDGQISSELRKKILKQAVLYSKITKEKNKKKNKRVAFPIKNED